jgi:hypothetical protein
MTCLRGVCSNRRAEEGEEEEDEEDEDVEEEEEEEDEDKEKETEEIKRRSNACSQTPALTATSTSPPPPPPPPTPPSGDPAMPLMPAVLPGLVRGAYTRPFSSQLKSIWSHLPESPGLIDWWKNMHPSYPTKCAYVEPKVDECRLLPGA